MKLVEKLWMALWVHRKVLKKNKSVSAIPVGYPVGGFCHSYELAGGKSVTFSVPSEHLADGLIIRIPFNYQWEGITKYKPLHFITYSSSGLRMSK